jgi:putative membrane protein
MHHAHHAGFAVLVVSAVLIAVALVYLCGSKRLRSADAWRIASFLFGLLFIWAALASPLATLDHQSLTAHMVQHLLLMTFAPLLIWLGAPIEPMVSGLPQRSAERLLAVASRPSARRWRKAITNPAVCWLGAAITLFAWHIPAIFMLGVRSQTWHAIEQTSFLVTGLLFWLPVIQPSRNVHKPEWLMLVYLFLATLPCDILSGFLVFCDRVIYPAYANSVGPFGLSALEDQQAAGALMWTTVTILYFMVAMIYAVRSLSPRVAREDRLVRSHPESKHVSADTVRMAWRLSECPPK